MNDETSATVDIFNTPAPSPQPSQPTDEEGSLEDILTQSSRDLVRTFAASITHSAAKEGSKSEEFRQELKRRLFRVIVDTYIWSTARIAHEMETAEGQLGKGVQELLAAEREQGRSSLSPLPIVDRARARLADLMAAVSQALEMFG